MKQIRHTRSLLNFLNGYTNKNEKEIESPKYKFTAGVIYLEDGLVATDRRLLLKVDIPDVPKEMKNKSYDTDDNLVSDDVDNMSLLLSLNQSRTNAFILDFNKWEERYNEIKKHKSKNVRNTVKLCDGLVVDAKHFNHFVNICKKYDAWLIKFNEKTFSLKKGQVQAVGVNHLFYGDEGLYEY